MWPLWGLIDMTPEGRPGDWSWPALDYRSAAGQTMR